MKVSIILFPGTNCEHDIIQLYQNILGYQVSVIWHTETDLKKPDLVVLPGGFSYGDYLRTGALAKLSPVMGAIKTFAAAGGAVLGICNGFQILCESGLLPGVLLQNADMRFLSQFVQIKVEQTATPFSKGFKAGAIITCPIAHFEGNYYANAETLRELEENKQVVFRYCNAQGQVDAQDRESNPNGSLNSIAGICNQSRNIVGLMPHPERAVETLVGSVGGKSGFGVFAPSL